MADPRGGRRAQPSIPERHLDQATKKVMAAAPVYLL
jgi:hypothetical protein